MPYLDESFDQKMKASAFFRCVVMLFVENTFFAMISFGWVRSEGSRPHEVGHALDHREKFLI